jgi:exodeoxyribonuclease VII large subunit
MKVHKYQQLCFQRCSKGFFTPKEGDHVLVSGRMSFYEPSGTYSIQVSTMKLDGIGELYLKYEALKKN